MPIVKPSVDFSSQNRLLVLEVRQPNVKRSWIALRWVCEISLTNATLTHPAPFAGNNLEQKAASGINLLNNGNSAEVFNESANIKGRCAFDREGNQGLNHSLKVLP